MPYGCAPHMALAAPQGASAHVTLMSAVPSPAPLPTASTPMPTTGAEHEMPKTSIFHLCPCDFLGLRPAGAAARLRKGVNFNKTAPC